MKFYKDADGVIRVGFGQAHRNKSVDEVLGEGKRGAQYFYWCANEAQGLDKDTKEFAKQIYAEWKEEGSGPKDLPGEAPPQEQEAPEAPQEQEAPPPPKPLKVILRVAKEALPPPEVHHEIFPTLIKISKGLLEGSIKGGMWLYGPAGTGKSHLAQQLAEAYALPFYQISLCKTTEDYKMLGYMYMDQYRTTAFRQAWEHGGVYLLDEVDNGNPNILAVLNSALSNGVMSFPDQVLPVKKHDNFLLVATANTQGTGATHEYVGRNAIDAATLDRFVEVFIPIDETLEMRIALGLGEALKMPKKQTAGWVTSIRKYRRAIEKLQITHLVSPRAVYDGLGLLANGVPQIVVENGRIWKSCPPEDVARIREVV
jgi:cobaltochelatase CobS